MWMKLNVNRNNCLYINFNKEDVTVLLEFIKSNMKLEKHEDAQNTFFYFFFNET